ncbi:hypothetical protein MMC13_006192 [Lambiella insularis]|nr:hypothetical protein [Lambiella insularis]
MQARSPSQASDTLEETPIETARREALEEIGLPNDVHKLPAPFQVDHLCELPSNLALTELGVRPCVAFLHTGENPVDSEETLMPRLEPKEVSAIFFASLRSFLSDRDPRGRDAVTGSRWYQGREGTWFGTRGRVHQFNVPKKGGNASLPEDSYKVFGMTARMLIDTARLAYAEEPSFEYEHHLGDEEVLRKLLNSGRLSAEKQSGSHITREDVAKAAKM